MLCPGVVATNIGTSGRNRPSEYGGPVDPNRTEDRTSEMLAKGLDPDIVGRQVLEAIQDDQPYIFTDPGLRYLIEQRSAEILAGYDWADQCKALQGVEQSGLLPE